MKQRREYKAPEFIGQNVYIKPSYIVSIPEFYREGGNTRTANFLANQANLLDNDHKGSLSKKAVKGMKNAINWLCLSAKKKRVYVEERFPRIRSVEQWEQYQKELAEHGPRKGKTFFFKVNFITLTLPDTEQPITSDMLQKKLLNPWLTYMRTYKGLKNYVWRLEFQKNGKLHVHISTDTFIHLRDIQDRWNSLLFKNGFMELYREKNNGDTNPNSTDVHAVRKIRNMAAYLAKYMGKKGNRFEYTPKMLSDKLNSALESGLSDKVIKSLIIKKNEALNKKIKPWGWNDKDRFLIQRDNFWNSPLNPRLIKGRIWGCSTELSRANKLMIHIPNSETIGEDLKCLMRPDIECKEITVDPPKSQKISASMDPDNWRNKKRKIGEVYFLKAEDWFTKITGPIRKAFDDMRWLISRASATKPVLNLTG